VNLSRRYHFNEIGTYKIIVKVKMESRTTMLSHGDKTFDENKSFEVVSNPLFVIVVPDKSP
jgi:hypothetical protein